MSDETKDEIEGEIVVKPSRKIRRGPNPVLANKSKQSENSDPQFVVIAYDIVDDRRRNQIFKALKNHGRHVQYSVFECDLSLKVIASLQNKLARLINAEEDNIRFYYLDRDAIGKIEELGTPRGPSLERLAHFAIL